MINLALIQMMVRGGRRDENVRHAVNLIRQSAREGANMALLPEAMTLGWTHPSALSEAEPVPDGLSCRALQKAARESRVYVCAGLVEKAGAAVYNAAVLIEPSGTLLLHHRKINELDVAQEFYASGDRLRVAQTPLGSIGLMICADAFVPGQSITRALGHMGAELILSPCSWAVPEDHDNRLEPYGRLWSDNYGPVARDFRLWIAGASNVGPLEAGPWRGRNCIGCSLVVGPDGETFARGPYGREAEVILHAKIDGRRRR